MPGTTCSVATRERVDYLHEEQAALIAEISLLSQLIGWDKAHLDMRRSHQ